jgi:DNA-binding transcriptional MerR regulator
MPARSEDEVLEREWLRIGLSAPARRALVEAKLYRVSDLRRLSLTQLTELHGMGKSSIARIRQIMDAKKIEFARL